MTPKVHSVSVEIGGRPLILETGWLAKQASGAVTVKQDESAVLVTAVGSTEQRDFDFLPLTVDYMDRTAASGKIPGGFLKREGRGNERETLVSRLIDRPLRPQFPKHFRLATVMMQAPATVDEIAAASGASREEVCDLLNAYLATGFAEPEQVQASVAAETARTGLLDRLRGLRG